MARRKEFKGIAHDLLGFCCSRNFDIKGYWGVGVLHQFAFDQDLRDLHLDISPRFTKKSDGLDKLRKAFSRWLLGQMDCHGMPRNWLKQGYLQMSFETVVKPAFHHRFVGYGFPFVCDVVLISDLGGEYTSSAGGYCFRTGDLPASIIERRKEYWNKPLFLKWGKND